jgi:hypothetical protein
MYDFLIQTVELNKSNLAKELIKNTKIELEKLVYFDIEKLEKLIKIFPHKWEHYDITSVFRRAIHAGSMYFLSKDNAFKMGIHGEKMKNFANDILPFLEVLEKNRIQILINKEFVSQITFTDKDLPLDSLPLSEWAQQELPNDIESKILDVFTYLIERGEDPLREHFYWSPSAGFDNRVIIPFKFHGRIVGYTARKITAGRPKYVSDQHPFFVFNLDNQKANQKYTLVTEGPFDAIAINGVGLLGNGIGDQQARLINELGTKPILVPDQDLAGIEAIDRAIELGWGVAFPIWDKDVKDCADAVRRYGRLYVTVDAVKSAQWGNIKIELAKKKLETHLKSLELKD